MEPAEFILKIFIICVLCFGLLGMIVASSQFEGIVKNDDNQRLTIDLAHAASASPCLTQKINGESRKGLLSEANLDANKNTKACIDLPIPWSVIVSDGSRTWTFGTGATNKQYEKTLPVSIRAADGRTVLGTVTANIGGA